VFRRLLLSDDRALAVAVLVPTTAGVAATVEKSSAAVHSMDTVGALASQGAHVQGFRARGRDPSRVAVTWVLLGLVMWLASSVLLAPRLGRHLATMSSPSLAGAERQALVCLPPVEECEAKAPAIRQ